MAEKTKMDYTHPLFLQPSDTPGLVLIPIQLTGSENYGLWSRSMRLALKAKCKLGFINGTCIKASFEANLHEKWETCNAIVHSWIMNSVSKDLLSGIIYALDAHAVWEDLKEHFDKELWAEYDVLVPSPNCGCVKSKEYIEHLHQQILMQLLDGLNDTYDQAKRQILMKTTKPTLNQAYAMVIQNESQQSLGGIAMEEKVDPMAMEAGRDFRVKKGHQERDYRPKEAFTAVNNVEGPAKTSNSRRTSQQKGGDFFFTEAQYQRILHLLSKDAHNDNQTQANMADNKLENVLYVPDFKFNLMFVSKLTRDIQCGALFLPKLCGFQDLYSGRVKGIGKKTGGLYLLRGRGTRQLAAALISTLQKNEVSGDLWHRRLGHPSLPVMKHISFLHNKVDNAIHNKCSIFPLAK
ncbi:uncharacterized protein [Nicotiana sylvestris]|uniref:uncharacterized protein n=1 Tax=Nicotiana sylvestris TaxID=4096 RepID=UPI00388C44C0